MYGDDIVSIFNKDAMQAQAALEVRLLQHGYDKAIKSTAEEYQRARNSGNITGMPKGTAIFLEVLESVTTWLHNFIDQQSRISRKSVFYNNLIVPYSELYRIDQERATKYRPGIFENPIDLLTFFITRELTSLMVIEDRRATEISRKIVDHYTMSYNKYDEATPEELGGMIQLLRTYIGDESNRFFTENKETDSSVTFTLKDEMKGLFIEEDDLLSSVPNVYSSFKPMLVEPLEHRNLMDSNGGYLELNSPILKRPIYETIRQMPFHGNQWFDSLNKLQNTKWQINTPFLEWMRECTYPGVQERFNTDSYKMQVESSKFVKSMNREIYKLKKRCTDLFSKIQRETDFATKRDMAIERMRAHDRIEMIEADIEISKKEVSRARGWENTLKDAEFFSQFPCFYHPIFCDNRGRLYTYNTSLSFQGNSLAKSIVCTHHKERMDSEAVDGVLELLGGMFEGYSKKIKEVRLEMVNELLPRMWDVIEHTDYSVLNDIDEDELLCALVIMFELYHHFHDESYETGLLAYIDSTSSAIQIQALCQKCEKAASLTNLLPVEGEDLPDAYQEVAYTSKDLIKEVAEQSDDDIASILTDYYAQNDPEKLDFIGNIY